MSRWFRHYAGLCRDEKLVSVAIKSKQPIERVVWVWAAILESAAEIDDGGRYSLDAAEVAYFLRADEPDILAVEDALANAGRLAEGFVVKWGNRQFKSDRSAERVAAYRERKRPELCESGHVRPSLNGDVTLQKRHGNSPDTELDTETEKKDTSLRSVTRAARADFDLWWDAWPHKVGKPAGEKAFLSARKKTGVDIQTLLAGVERYIADKPPDRPWCNPATWLNQERWNDQPAAVESRSGPSDKLTGLFAIHENLRVQNAGRAQNRTDDGGNRSLPATMPECGDGDIPYFLRDRWGSGSGSV